MGTPNKDEIEGKLKQGGGAVKEHVGRATGNADLEGEGIADRAEGNVQSGVGEVKRKTGDFIKDVGDKIRK